MDRRMVDWDDWKLVRTLQFALVSFIGVCGVVSKCGISRSHHSCSLTCGSHWTTLLMHQRPATLIWFFVSRLLLLLQLISPFSSIYKTRHTANRRQYTTINLRAFFSTILCNIWHHFLLETRALACLVGKQTRVGKQWQFTILGLAETLHNKQQDSVHSNQATMLGW